MILFFLISTALAQTTTIPNNKVAIGKTGAADKTLEFNLTKAGASTNPKVKWNNTAGQLQFSNNGTDFTSFGASSVSNSYLLENFGLTASVAASALTVAFKTKALTDATALDFGTISFRSATADSGTFVTRTLVAASSIVISSGSTLGHVSGANEYIYIYAIDNAGTIEPAISSTLYDEGTIITTTVLAGGGGDDSRTAIYSTVSRSGVGLRLVARLKSNQATAGTWNTAISEISLVPFEKSPRSQVHVYSQLGTGSTNTYVAEFNTVLVDQGPCITRATSAANGDSFTINCNGLYSMSYGMRSSSSVVIPLITRNSTTLNADASAFTISPIGNSSNSSTIFSQAHVIYYLKSGDVIRAQLSNSNALDACTSIGCGFNIIQIGY